MAPRTTHQADTDDTTGDDAAAQAAANARQAELAVLAVRPGCVWPATSTEGDQGDDVAALEVQLGVRGWYRGAHSSPAVYDVYTEQAVQQLQRELERLGRYSGPIHGQFDDATRDAACSTFPS